MIFRGGASLEHELTASTRLVGRLLVEAGADNTFASNDLTLQVEMTQRLAVALGLGLRHSTRPPAGLRNTKALTTVNLVYAF